MASNNTSKQVSTTKKGKEEPEYTEYGSMKTFFDEKRQQLLEKTSARGAFFHVRDPLSFHALNPLSIQDRIAPGTRGGLINPPPPGQPRSLRTPEEAKAFKKSRNNKKLLTRENPGWCLRRAQVIAMWNQEILTDTQELEREEAIAKMEALGRKYKLFRVKVGTGEYLI